MKGVDILGMALRTSSDSIYTVPGFPVTELGTLTGAEIVVNEKVALEYALGDSLSGRRAAVIVKNVGLNACADPLLQAATQGLRAGVIVVAGDDTCAICSQNAQDSRYYGELAESPVLEPDVDTCARAVEEAFQASEAFSRVAIVRITPELLDSAGEGVPEQRQNRKGDLADPKLTMYGRVVYAKSLLDQMFTWSRQSSLNRFLGKDIAAGAAHAGPGASRVVTVYPPPAGPSLIRVVHELGRPFLKEHCHLLPPGPIGKPQRMEDRGYHLTFCRECPFILILQIMKEREMKVICDAGCTILATNPPFEVGIASYGLGSSVGVAAKSTRIALIGDYALLHSGINALIDVFLKGVPLLCIVFRNKQMGMTGGQQAPDPVTYLGWAAPVVCDSSDREALSAVLRAPDRPRVIVIEGECPAGSVHEHVAY